MRLNVDADFEVSESSTPASLLAYCTIGMHRTAGAWFELVVSRCYFYDFTDAIQSTPLPNKQKADVFAIELQKAGYTTLMAGKYLNGKTVSHCPGKHFAIKCGVCV